jgi:hypothetical protein
MEKLNVRFNDGTKAELKSLSVSTGLSESVIARAALNRGLARFYVVLAEEGLDKSLDVIATYEPLYGQ